MKRIFTERYTFSDSPSVKKFKISNTYIYSTLFILELEDFIWFISSRFLYLRYKRQKIKLCFIKK